MELTKKQHSVLKSLGIKFTKVVYLNPNACLMDELNFNLSKEIIEITEKDFEVNLRLNVTSVTDNDFSIVIELCGKFFIESEDEDLKKVIKNKNSIAILFPYLRSELTLLTSQPGIEPIIMPPININAMFDK